MFSGLKTCVYATEIGALMTSVAEIHVFALPIEVLSETNRVEFCFTCQMESQSTRTCDQCVKLDAAKTHLVGLLEET